MQKRKKILVSQAIQGRVLARFCGYWLFYNALLLVGLAFNIMMSPDAPNSFPDLVKTIFQQNFWTIAILVLVFPIVFRDLLVTTHRIVGPLSRFELALLELTKGKHVAEVRLRKNDMLIEFRDVFNEYIAFRNRELEKTKKEATHKALESEHELAGA
jgi:hypothetical protein